MQLENKIGLTVIILTFNEELNLPYALDSVIGWADQVFVVDSFSTDGTLEIAKNYNVPVYQNPWTDWATQRNWALSNLPVRNEWIFFLDADEQVTRELKKEIEVKIKNASPEVAAYSVRQAFVFLGRYLKHAHDAPPLIRLVRRGRVKWFCKGAREYCEVKGKVKQLKHRLWHEDHKGISEWIQKQNLNATREALAILNAQNDIKEKKKISAERPLRTWIRENIYARLPRWLRPFFHFTYRYFLRMGFLDGYPGFVFCFLHAFWLPLLIDAKVYEIKRKNSRQKAFGAECT
ncbi:MAG: glycosyltransferase family 2 protein [Deltaproteobacteria bacterium]|nr:MAG: glycosyltransferase family 2 protein [Deltaproteobacteria bacterium]